MRLSKMILAMGLALVFSGCGTNDLANHAPICQIPNHLPQNYQKIECIGTKGWLKFTDTEQKEQRNVGIMDAKGKIIVPAQYAFIDEHKAMKNLFFISQNADTMFARRNRGILNDDLEWILPFEKQSFDFVEGSHVISVTREKNDEPISAFFDTQSQQFITPFKYTLLARLLGQDDLAQFSTAPMYQNGEANENYLIGFVNHKGEEVIPEIYANAGRFSEGVNWVEEQDGKRWLINTKGQKLWQVPSHYVELSASRKGLITVSDDVGHETMIDHSGKEIVPLGQFDFVKHSEHFPVLFVQKGSKFGLLDLKGNVVLPLNDYDTAEDSSDENDKSLVFVKDFQVSHYDENGKLLKTNTSPYAEECAHVKLGAKNRHGSNRYVVSSMAGVYRNRVQFSVENSFDLWGTCDDVAKPVAKSHQKR